MTTELLYGINTITNILEQTPESVVEIFVSNTVNNRINNLIITAKTYGIAIQKIKKSNLEKMLRDSEARHQGIIAKCKLKPVTTDLLGFIKDKQDIFLLILDGVQDPHNLGACLRSADAFGVTAVVIPRNNAAQITSSVRKVASGAAENVNIIAVSNLARTLEQLKTAGVWLVGLDATADKALQQIDLQGNIALILGSEAKGMSSLTRKHCDYLAALPMCGVVSSLNVAVAAGISLFEATRQRS